MAAADASRTDEYSYRSLLTAIADVPARQPQPIGAGIQATTLFPWLADLVAGAAVAADLARNDKPATPDPLEAGQASN